MVTRLPIDARSPSNFWDEQHKALASQQIVWVICADELLRAFELLARQAEEDVRRRIEDLRGWCEAGGAVHVEMAMSTDDEIRLWRLRHAASPILNELAPKLQNMQIVEDGCVPPPRFAEYVRGVRAALDRARFKGVIFGHAGDAHAHVNALVDTSEHDWRARAARCYSTK